jgi:hypothetical protein
MPDVGFPIESRVDKESKPWCIYIKVAEDLSPLEAPGLGASFGPGSGRVRGEDPSHFGFS